MMIPIRTTVPAENMRKWFDLPGTFVGQERKDTRWCLTEWLAKCFPQVKYFGPKWQYFAFVKFDEELFERAEELGLTRYQYSDTEARIKIEGRFFVPESELATYVEGAIVKVSLGTIDSASQYFTGALPIRFKLQVLQSSDEVEEIRRTFPEKKTFPGVVEVAIRRLQEREERRKQIELSDTNAAEDLAKSTATLFAEPKVAQVVELLSLTNERIYLGVYRDEKNTCWYVYACGGGIVELEDSGRIPWADNSGRLSRIPIERTVSYEDFARRAVRTNLDDIESLRRKILDGGYTVATRLTKRGAV